MPALASRRTDAVVAAVLAVASVVQVLAMPIAPRAVGIVIALSATVPVAFRRSHPVAALIVGTAWWVYPTDGYLVVGYVAVFLLLYSFAVAVDDIRIVVAAPVILLGLSVSALLRSDEPIGEWLGSILAVSAPVAVGRFVRRERERTHQTAVSEERARIARELHDVVAHGVSVIAVQADAAEAALEHDPARAATPLRSIRGSAHDALAEMRRMVGVLGETHERGSAARARAAARADRGVRRDAGDHRRAGRGAGVARPRRLSDRAGGAHERPQARRQRADDRAHHLAREGARARRA